MEYVDRDETIIVHRVGGLDALIKVPHGWPVLNVALKLKSLQSSDHHARTISSSYLRKVEVSIVMLSVCLHPFFHRVLMQV